jgi:hypothetical protein
MRLPIQFQYMILRQNLDSHRRQNPTQYLCPLIRHRTARPHDLNSKSLAIAEWQSRPEFASGGNQSASTTNDDAACIGVDLSSGWLEFSDQFINGRREQSDEQIHTVIQPQAFVQWTKSNTVHEVCFGIGPVLSFRELNGQIMT